MNDIEIKGVCMPKENNCQIEFDDCIQEKLRVSSGITEIISMWWSRNKKLEWEDEL